MWHACYECHLKTVQHLLKKFKPEPDTEEAFSREVKELLDENPHMSTPYLATLLHRKAREKLNNSNLYREEKQQATQLLLSHYSFWKKRILESEDPFHTAALLAVSGNIIDYGAHSTPVDIEAAIHQLTRNKLVRDHSESLKQHIDKASSILYLGDNAGEIVFDRLFIETMNHPNVRFVVRGAPVINDVTLDDAIQAGMHHVCQVMDNGFDAPSTLLPHCSEELQETFRESDLVISKGQGNYEGLLEEKREGLFFLLMAKCTPMAKKLGVQKGEMVILESGRNL